jgi:hypothetical protein
VVQGFHFPSQLRRSRFRQHFPAERLSRGGGGGSERGEVILFGGEAVARSEIFTRLSPTALSLSRYDILVR